jgi:hypothetical protein
MSFPIGPSDQQIFTTAFGSRYRYIAANAKWVKDGVLPLGVTGAQGFTGAPAPGVTGFQGPTGIPGGNTVLLFADQLDYPVSADWPVTGISPTATDTNNSGITVRLFDDTNEEGAGFLTEIPAWCTSVKFEFRSRAQATPAGAVGVVLRLYMRQFADNAAVGAWSAATTLTTLDFTTNQYYQYDTQTITLATLGLTVGQITQFELTRYGASGSDTLVGDWALFEVKITFL